MSNYVVLDLEMCRIHSNQKTEIDLKTEVIQIGAVLLNESLDIIDTFVTYVSPPIGHIDSFIKHLTGISNTKTKDAPCFKEAIQLFLKWIPKDTVFVAWSDSDEAQIKTEIEKKDIDINEFENKEWIDCQKLFSEKVNSSKNYSLSEALRISCVDFESQEHDALIDAMNTAKLFKSIQSDFKFNEYYVNEHDFKRTLYNPFAELLANYNFIS